MQWLSEEDLGNKMASRFANRHHSVKVWISARDNMDLRRNCVIFVILTIYSAG